MSTSPVKNTIDNVPAFVGNDQSDLLLDMMDCVYSKQEDAPVLHLFGRSPVNINKRLQLDIHGFDPYFYVEGTDVKYSSQEIKEALIDPVYFHSIFDDKDVAKIKTYIPDQVSRLRDSMFSSVQTYQSKIIYPLNFICTTNIKSGLRVRKNKLRAVSDTRNKFIVKNYKSVSPVDNINITPKTLLFDIEVDNIDGNPKIVEVPKEEYRHGQMAFEGNKPVIMSSFIDNYSNILYTFAWHPSRKEPKLIKKTYEYVYSKRTVPWHVFLFTNEKEMMKKMKEFILKKDPDIFTSWNTDFDVCYLISRYNALKIDPSFLSPVGYVTLRKKYAQKKKKKNNVKEEEKKKKVIGYTPHIAGRSVMDMLSCYKLLTRFDGMKDSYKLDDVGFDELDLKKLRYEGSVGNLWRDNFSKCIYYNVRDVEICDEINNKLHVIQYYDVQRRMAGCFLEDTVSTKKLVETEILRTAMHIGTVVPTKSNEGTKEDKFTGAYVFDPIIGIHKNVIMLDLKSLYPSIIITLNISPETIVDESKYTRRELSKFCKSCAGHYYLKEKIGFAKGVLIRLNEHRDMYKECDLAMTGVINSQKRFDTSNPINFKKSLITILKENSNKVRAEAIEDVSKKLESINFDNQTDESIIKVLKSEKLTYDLMQKAEKAKINTWYGVMGHEGSSLYRIEDAESVTITGQEIIKFTASMIESNELKLLMNKTFGVDVSPKVIYGDTDSVFIAGFENISDGDIICKMADILSSFVTKKYDIFCKERLNVETHALKIRAEKIAKVFALAPKKSKGEEDEEGGKKRYFWKPWFILEGDKKWVPYVPKKEKDKIKVVGFESKRSNVSKIGRETQKKVMEFLLDFAPKRDIRKYLKTVKKKVLLGKIDLEDITFNVSLKDWSEYDCIQKGKPESSWLEHVRAAWWGNTYFKQNWKAGDKVKVIHVRRSPAGYRKMRVIAIENGRLPKGFEIDYGKMYEKQVIDKMTMIFKCAKTTYNAIMTGKSSKKIASA